MPAEQASSAGISGSVPSWIARPTAMTVRSSETKVAPAIAMRPRSVTMASPAAASANGSYGDRSDDRQFAPAHREDGRAAHEHHDRESEQQPAVAFDFDSQPGQVADDGA